MGKGARGQEGKEAIAVLPSCHLAIRRNVNSFLKHAKIGDIYDYIEK
jgi:hypothetical protein